jgi:hypothetical protein
MEMNCDHKVIVDEKRITMRVPEAAWGGGINGKVEAQNYMGRAAGYEVQYVSFPTYERGSTVL